ncbi:MAG: site-specific DNA-methyltransferase, partial [Candidatus Micrarchaeota archaeon]
LQAYKEYIDGESSATEEDAKKQKKLAEIRNKFLNKDGLEELKNLNDGSIRLVLVDPPYGMNYQSNRRWKSEKRDKIKGDTMEESLLLVDNLLKTVKTKLMDDAHLLIFTNSKQLCNIRNLFIKNEYNLKGELIWVKEEHGTGDLKGTFAPQHEYIVHGNKGKPEISPRKSTVFQVAREHGANPKGHPTEKPVALLKELIEATTSKGELVIDTFAGTASTLVAALEMERDYWGCEIDKEYWEKGIARLEAQMGQLPPPKSK